MHSDLKEANGGGQEDRIIDDGFSSQQELQHEEIHVEEPKQEVQESNHKEQVRFRIPPPPQIKDKSYSLRPDIETGWQTKLDLPVPVPIIFESERFDQLIRRVLKQPRQRAKLCYLGPRYENTYYAWYDKPFRFPYDHIKAPNDMKFTNRPFCGQHWQAQDDLVFDSFFEGGNLDCVMRVGEREYDCFMRVDSNTAGHLQWFNFKVKGWKKLLKYKINICNFQKDKCLFARGMKPYIYSQKKYKKEKIGWQQDGENVRFQRKQITASKVYDFDLRHMFRLSFQYYTQYEQDEVQIAYCIPYTYTRLSEFLLQLSSKPQTKSFLKISKLCNSLGGLQVPLVLVHQGLEEQQGGEVGEGISRRCVVVSGRAHPGQSNGSHMMEGFMEWLCGGSKEATLLRRYIVFKIVPMLNPDGVAIGNYRTGLSGRDFNRQYRSPDKALFPEVYHFKKLVAQNKCIFGDKLLMFLDFHGHSTKKNTFMYGPQFPIVDRFYYQARLFPKLLGNATSMFRYYSCIFKINSFKQTTARAIILKRIGVPLSYTIQTSNGSFFDYEQLCDVPYTQILWKNMGGKVGEALHQYVDLVLTADRNRYEKNQSKRKDKNDKGKKQPPKTSKRSPQKSAPQRVSIFTAMQNEKIKHLFEQIKKAQAQKQLEKVSDDELSEGSSDLQGQQNDLSAAQANYLIDVIKGGKCKSVSRCKMRTKVKIQQHRTTEDACKIQAEVIEKSVQEVEQQGCQSQEVLLRKKAINIRKPISSKQRINLSIFQTEDKKVNTAKIINFSFCSQSPRNKYRQSPERRLNLPSTKLNFIELVAGKWSQERVRERRQSQGKNKVVVDLSDPHFRKTFTYNMRERKQQTQKLTQAQGHYIPSKRGRFDHFKYRRLLLSGNQQQGNPHHGN